MNQMLAINGGDPISRKTIPIHMPYLDKNDFNIVYNTIKSSYVSGNGPACMEFEKELAKYLEVKHVFYTNSCTAALDLAFKVKNFPSGSEVIVPNFTYTSTALAPLLNNLKVQLVDVNSYNGNIDLSKIEAAINQKTVAIVPVDYAGNPVEMEPILEIAKKHNLYVVHDTAQSLGSEYRCQKSGVLADVATYSFHGTKNMTTGEGGALVTNCDEIAQKVAIMREKGTDKQSFLVDKQDRGYYQYVDIGNSYVQSNLNGSLGITQLRKLDWMNSKRNEIAQYYIEELHSLPNIELPKITENSKTNWHIFYILVPPKQKYWIMDALRAEGVQANVHYTPLHRNKFYSHLGCDVDFPGSMEFFNRLLRIPIFPSLSKKQQQYIVKAVKKVIQSL